MSCYEDFAIEQMNGIVVSAYQELLDERAVDDEFCWGYYLRIENNTNDKICLIKKSISVTDIKGHSVSEETDGFRGETPELAPGEVFEFEDYATSKTNAVLYGSFQISNLTKKVVEEIKLPVLSLIANDNELILN